MVALLSSSDGYKALVAVVLRLIDFDNTSTELTNFVDFLTTLADDGTDLCTWNQ